MLAKILIKERENSVQLANCGTDYFEGGLLIGVNYASISVKFICVFITQLHDHIHIH